ncbi:MAG: 1-(5-phosphoribosyl)-5-amino-4-imidazole-carboxylate carboxylase, partial [Acidobacteria bacterium]
MDERDIRRVLERLQAGGLSVEDAVERLRHLPSEDLGFQGFAEVIFGDGKTPLQVTAIVRGMLRPKDSKHNILITRAGERIYRAVRRVNAKAKFYPLARAIVIRRNRTITGKGTILILAAGTSDISVAEEAALTAEIMGNRVETVYDVGVAG